MVESVLLKIFFNWVKILLIQSIQQMLKGNCRIRNRGYLKITFQHMSSWHCAKISVSNTRSNRSLFTKIYRFCRYWRFCGISKEKLGVSSYISARKISPVDVQDPCGTRLVNVNSCRKCLWGRTLTIGYTLKYFITSWMLHSPCWCY